MGPRGHNSHTLISTSDMPVNQVSLSHRKNFLKQGKSEGFDSCDQPSNLTQIGFKSLINVPM